MDIIRANDERCVGWMFCLGSGKYTIDKKCLRDLEVRVEDAYARIGHGGENLPVRIMGLRSVQFSDKNSRIISCDVLEVERCVGEVKHTFM